ncbi:unnamed protein product [Darwinula stevensoni]|uniref:Uncharacterized protein n=1 Tax=Darwinula stevensoni TaxID=69355 RepID=A0A7R9FTW4_9CRUS|nr:unnamed protein product [Darwinula stevensoni]CAG0905699.1 unnamed protein product [Darwinula stevensoni]
MGISVSKVMQENLEKNQEFMLEMQKIQVERQIQMQNQMRERMMAMQLARSREFFYWFLGFYGVCTAGMLLGGVDKERGQGDLGHSMALKMLLWRPADHIDLGDCLHKIWAFYVLYSVCCLGCRYRTTRQKRVLLPLVPLTFILSYQADLCYGSKLKRIQVEAEQIMEFEHDSLEMPFGVPSLSSIDQARMRQSDERRLKKVHDIYF